MRIRMRADAPRRLIPLAIALLGFAACDDGDEDPMEPTPGMITFQAGGGTMAVGETTEYTIDGLDDAQAYRITLVVDANITPGGNGTATFIDEDMNGAADAGPSETIALITAVNGVDVDGAKTVPGGMDDPAAPSGVFPTGGTITLTVTGVAAGTVHPVAYHNGGASTFLEIDGEGVPTENYAVGASATVTGGGAETITPMPAADSPIEAGGTVDYTISGLNDDQAYRITLVVDANITPDADGATFVDNDMNGAADAGPSETIALITSVNGMPVAGGDGAKTVPGGMDDPAAPSGVFPTGGAITLTVTGVAAGTVHPVVYHNGGASTFLELGGDGRPVEAYAVAGSVTVSGGGGDMIMAEPAVDSAIPTSGEVDYTISGLDDEQAYRITLVVDANITLDADGATFVDNDMNGAADAGASENIARIVTVNGMDIGEGMGAKTVPGGMDDPSDPSGVFPVDGVITLRVLGRATGRVHPVVYHNGGASTFLEIDGDGRPIEAYAVAGSVTVAGPTPVVMPNIEQNAAVDGTVDLSIAVLNENQAYRITLVVADNVAVNGNRGTFVDNDMNGAADAGPSENVALITAVNGMPVADGMGAKTVPGGMDDPAAPSGVFPEGAQISLTLTGVGAGTVRPVVYENGGDSTFLEVDGDGNPIEIYSVGPAVTIQ